MNVPFLDLKAQYQPIRDEIHAALQQVFDSTAFAGGAFVEQFEKEFAGFCRCQYAVGVGSGTEALWLALLALGIGPGDEVITVPNTFIATAEAISFCGATPAFVDINDQTYTMDPQKLNDYLSLTFSTAKAVRPKAIIPVHLYGQTADMDPLIELARRYELFVIEDACQAHGSEYKGRRAGSFGDAGCFSFYPGKNLGAYGEAGAVVTNSGDLADKIRRLRDHGQAKKYFHANIGWNARMDGLQGAVLSVKLRHLEEWTKARRNNADLYSELLADINHDRLTIPCEADYAKHVYHLYVLRTSDRDGLISMLTDHGIGCGIHYPVPLHLTEAYQNLRYGAGSFPVAEKCASQLVSLPMYSELNKSQIERVAEQVRAFLETTAARKHWRSAS